MVDQIYVLSHHRRGAGTPLASLSFSSRSLQSQGVILRFFHTSSWRAVSAVCKHQFVLFDGIHCLRYGLAPCIYFLSRILRKNVAIYWHDVEGEISKARAFFRPRQLMKLRHPLAVRSAMRQNDIMHFHISVYGCRLLTQKYRISTDRICHLPACSNSRSVCEYQVPRKKAPRYYVAVGTCSYGKGTDLFLDVAEKVCARDGNARFVWAGGFGQPPFSREQLEAEVERKGLQSRVSFVGYTDRVFDIVADAESLVVCSRDEGLGKMVQEAFALGTHVVAHRLGGLPEVVGDLGTLVEPGDVSAMADALLFGDTDKNSAQWQNLRRERYLREYSIEAFVANFLKALRFWQRNSL